MLNRLSDLVRLRTFATDQVQPVSRVNLLALSDLLAGDLVRAHVEALMPDGTYRVTIRNQPFQLRLPVQARPGDTLQLTVVAREPQLKFALSTQEDPAALSTTLSATGRFITALIEESERIPVRQVITAGAPLLTAMHDKDAQTAVALRQAIAHSGIFYESHQAQWVAGERALEALLHEPQARFGPLRRVGEGPLPARGDNANPLQEDAPALPELPVHRDALPIIRQQLDTLESQHVAWHGMIWRNQALDWEVAEPPPDSATSAEEQPWRTRLRLTLPRLGPIEATLLVSARGVTVTLNAANAETRTMLAGQRPQLQQALRDAGVNPLNITVRRDESA